MKTLTILEITNILREKNISVNANEKQLLEKALTLAIKAHDGQFRNSGEPYVTHVFAAAKNCANFGMSPTIVAAALLHDTIEDTYVTGKQVEEEFGKEIRNLVEGVTKLGKVKYQGDERHVESLRKFFIASSKDIRVVVIKIADRLHNLSTLSGVKPEKQKRIALESIEIYAALASRLGMGKLSGMIQDLAFPYAFPEDYKKVKKILEKTLQQDEKKIEKLHRNILKALAEKNLRDVKVTSRVKGMYSLFKKLQKKDWELEDIHDVSALRILTNSLEDCYRALGIVHSIWKPVPGRIKDYIAVPKPNGYQSLHTTIFLGDGSVAEIQIRTQEMHAICEYGVASHHAYKLSSNTKQSPSQKAKAKNLLPKESFSWLSQLNQFQKDQKNPSEYISELRTDFFEDRIFVFTPKGDVIDLPSNATILDFAFAVHSDIGSKAVSGLVNGKNAALKTELKSEDVVSIIVNKQSNPTIKWLDQCKTQLAKRFIRQFVNKQSDKK
jgi:GTP diphosphokinase / guanosine-3',5'-bis(diphosphate) 3'-diphosphatase